MRAGAERARRDGAARRAVWPARRRLALAAAGALALALGAAAAAEGFRQAPPPPAGSAVSPPVGAAVTTSATRPGVTPSAQSGDGASGAPGASDVAGIHPGASADPTAPDAPLSPSALTGAASLAGTPPAPALAGLQGGGDPAPVCRSACAGALYRCTAAGGDDTCQASARTCRADCDTTSQLVGRLVSPLPQAALAAAGPLRALPGSLSGPPPRQ